MWVTLTSDARKPHDQTAAPTELSADQQSLFDAGNRLFWPVERRTLPRALARHIRAGNTKVARSIHTEGIDSATYQICVAYWMSRAWLSSFGGLAILFLGPARGPAHIVGEVLLGTGGALMLVGAERLRRALRSRKRFREARLP